ncbi:MAG: hypothetical protein KKB30_00095 [Proteobacteria bacterium]|nr:hypothetical protein [Pseudomonadota bacterium]MBU1716555.1 hypothetical protein [Pseudomonadota bacterium]
MQRKSSYDFYLILATTAVLFVISIICIYSMFYFKMAQVQQLPTVMKEAYLHRMNVIVAPFITALILLLGICVPKRLLPVSWLNRFALVLAALTLITSMIWGVKLGMLLVLSISLILQTGVLGMALGGSKNLYFERKNYWVRVGSSLMHLGLILFVFDLFFFDRQALHLLLFWVTTISTVLGMIFCFYAESMVSLIKRLQLSRP